MGQNSQKTPPASAIKSILQTYLVSFSFPVKTRNGQEEAPGIYFRQVQHLWPSCRRCLWLQ